MCASGRVTGGGGELCTPCPASTFAPNAGSFECEECAIGHTSEPGASECTFCLPGFFESPSGDCTFCTERMVCHAKGTTLATLEIKKGYWRSSPESEGIYACPFGDTDACPGGNGTAESLCAEGYTGPFQLPGTQPADGGMQA